MFDKITSFTDSAFEKIDNFLNKKIVIWTIVILTTILGSIYYYGIISITKPNAEDCLWPYTEFLNKLSGQKTTFSNFVDFLFFKISYGIHGFSYKMPRLNFTLRYSAILFLSLILAIVIKKCNKNESNIYMLPIMMIFLVLLPIISENPGFGFTIDTHNDVFVSYPFNYHQSPLIMSLICIIILRIREISINRIIKIVETVILIILSVYGLLKTDAIFIVSFLAPAIIVIFLRLVRNEKYMKYCIGFVILLLFCFVFSKYFINPELHSLLWSSKFSDVYGGRIYGETNWKLSVNPLDNVSNYIVLLLELFGLDRTYTTIISLWSFIIVIKLMLVIIGLYITVDVVISTLKNSYVIKGYDVVDQICAFSVCCFSFLSIFTFLSISTHTNYFMGLMISITILTARNFVTVISRIFNTIFFTIKKAKILLMLTGVLFVLLSINNVWAYDIDTNGADIDRCIEYIKDSGEGYIIAPHLLFGRLAMQANGDVLFFGTIDQLKRFMGEDATPRYIVSNLDEDNLFYNYDVASNAHYGPFGKGDLYSFDNLTKEYGEPIETKKFGNIWVHRLW